MEESLSGGTTNLLRMARSGCQSSVAFVALALGDQTFATAMYPPTPDDDSLGAEDVDDLVRQLWLDPGFGQGKALVRTIRLGGRWLSGSTRRFAVAAVPLGTDEQGHPWGIVGVADPEAKTFGMPELELLSRISQRLASYVRARHEMRRQLSTVLETPGPEWSAGAEGSRAWWSVEPAPGGASGPAGSGTQPLPPVPGHDAGGLPTRGATTPTVPPPPVRSAGDVGEASRPQGAPILTQPPFPPPAGTAGARPAADVPWGTAGGRADVLDAGGPAPPPAGPVPSEAGADRPVVREAALATPALAAPAPAAPAPATPALATPALADLLGGGGGGLVTLTGLIGRTGRLLGASAAATGSIVVVALEVVGTEAADEGALAEIVRAIRAELRFDDPVARLGRTAFVAVVAEVPGAATGDVVEARLASAVHAGLRGTGAVGVRSAHVVAGLSAGRDADELVRMAVRKLRGA